MNNEYNIVLSMLRTTKEDNTMYIVKVQVTPIPVRFEYVANTREEVIKVARMLHAMFTTTSQCPVKYVNGDTLATIKADKLDAWAHERLGW